jgi:hypothetical protein
MRKRFACGGCRICIVTTGVAGINETLFVRENLSLEISAHTRGTGKEGCGDDRSYFCLIVSVNILFNKRRVY